jgi:hypothetical protein
MRPGLRLRGSKRRMRDIERQYGQDRWRILLVVLLAQALAVLTWALAFVD